MNDDLCPKCGAYWECDCKLDANMQSLDEFLAENPGGTVGTELTVEAWGRALDYLKSDYPDFPSIDPRVTGIQLVDSPYPDNMGNS